MHYREVPGLIGQPKERAIRGKKSSRRLLRSWLGAQGGWLPDGIRWIDPDIAHFACQGMCLHPDLGTRKLIQLLYKGALYLLRRNPIVHSPTARRGENLPYKQCPDNRC